MRAARTARVPPASSATAAVAVRWTRASQLQSHHFRADFLLADRLVDLGAIRELTGRETFRLYGV